MLSGQERKMFGLDHSLVVCLLSWHGCVGSDALVKGGFARALLCAVKPCIGCTAYKVHENLT
jgi:hypothetical protein